MTDQTFIRDDNLDIQLSDLGSNLEWYPAPDLAPYVVAGKAAPRRLPYLDRWRWLAAAVLAVALAGGVALAASSSIRSSVAEFLGIGGLRIEIGEPDTTPVSLPDLGTPTSMQDFARWLPFSPRSPSALGPPDALYLRVLENGDMLGIMTWEPGDALPPTDETRVGALLMQFEPPDDMIMMLKTVGLSTGSVTDTFVNGERAFWVEGASELTVFGDQDTDTRPTGNVLIWEQDGIGFRLESALSMADAMTIAESMQPAEPDNALS